MPTKDEKKELRRRYEAKMAAESWGAKPGFDGRVDPARLLPCGDPARMWPKYRFRHPGDLLPVADRLILVDPFAVAKFGTSSGEAASYLRANATILFELGGAFSCPVFWSEEFLVIPRSTHFDGVPPSSIGPAKVIADRFTSDTGAFAALSTSENLPAWLQKRLEELLSKGVAVSVEVPSGAYSFFYEQFYSPRYFQEPMFRNVVARRSKFFDSNLKSTQARPNSSKPWWRFW